MLYQLLTAVSAFVLCVILYKIFIPVFRKAKLGQKILEIGPSWHKCKEGTPTMGGLFFALVISATALTASVLYSDSDLNALFACIGYAMICCAIGFFDDYVKLFKKTNKGLSALQKFMLQLISSALFLFFLYITDQISTELTIPFFDITFDLGFLYYPVMLLVLVYFNNCSNFTDGLDGLNGSVALIMNIFFFILSVKLINIESMTYLTAAAIGGLLAYLVFNIHPAKIIMGDTGSLFLGGLICSMSIIFKIEILLALFAIIYLFEGLSVMIQVLYYKKTGKRIFKMAPIHHHFEMCGWSEMKIVGVFSLVTTIGCVLSYISIWLSI